VAVVEPQRARDPVHDHRVRGQARGGGIALVALEGRLAAVRADELLGDGIELAGRDPRLDVLLEERERPGDDAAGPRHDLDLLRRLADDHDCAAPPRAGSVKPVATIVSASEISVQTSSTVRSAWSGTSFPVTR